MNRRWKITGILFLGIASLSVYWYTSASRHPVLVGVTLHVGDRSFVVERVDTPRQRELGLGMREQLDSGRGMLFLFPESDPDRYAFWMKGMKFPLDIAWIRENRIVSLERNIPFDSTDIFRPSVPADSVLEVNSSALEGVSVGDPVAIEDP